MEYKRSVKNYEEQRDEYDTAKIVGASAEIIIFAKPFFASFFWAQKNEGAQVPS